MENAGFEKLISLFFVGFVCWNASAARAGELTDAVTADDLERVQILISGGADVNERGLFGTPLQMAVAKGSVEAARMLIDAGADLELRGVQARIPCMRLLLATKRRSPPFCRTSPTTRGRHRSKKQAKTKSGSCCANSGQRNDRFDRGSNSAA